MNEQLNELKELCAINGRAIARTDKGKLFTFDIYEGTDKQMFTTVKEAIDWEKGYQR